MGAGVLQTENQNGMIGKSSYTVQKRKTQIELQLLNEKQKQNFFSQLKHAFGWVGYIGTGINIYYMFIISCINFVHFHSIKNDNSETQSGLH